MEKLTMEEIISELQKDNLLEKLSNLQTLLKIRITIFWLDKEIFTYEIPKN